MERSENIRPMLLVEDEATVAATINAYFRKFGYQIEHVTTGEEAVNRVKDDTDFCVVIMDINLGQGMSGIEAAHQIHQIKDIPLVFLTSISDLEILKKTREVSRYGYISKNTGIQQILTSVELAMELHEKESALNAAIKEKDLLLREVHHRIKNNMTLMMSILSLQADATENSEAAEILTDAAGRLQGMLTIYDKLYRSGDFREINMSDYLDGLMKEVSKALNGVNTGVVLYWDIADVVLDVKKALNIGVIVNELISNAYKHAFPDQSKGAVRIQLTSSNGDITLSVSDNGTGITRNHKSIGETSFGMTLIHALVDQLGGTLAVKSNGGTTFTIEFPKQN